MDQSQTPVPHSTATTATTALTVAAPPAPVTATSQSATAVDAEIHGRLLRDYKRMRARVEALEAENESLRASLWEVSWRWGKRDKQNKSATITGTATRNPNGDMIDQPQQDQGDSVSQPLAAAELLGSSSEMTPRQLTPSRATNRLHQSTMLAAASSSGASSGPSPLALGQGDFMKLNEPIKIPALPSTTPSAPLPTTPSSLAASLFPSTPGVAGSTAAGGASSTTAHSVATSATGAGGPSTSGAGAPAAPSSNSSRTAPAIRDASLQRQLDIPPPATRNRNVAQDAHESWRWARAYDLKGHRGAVYSVKFGDGTLGSRGRVLASAAFDGVRLWGAVRAEGQATDGTEMDEPSDAWDDGDVEELAHLSSHSGPVSDVAFSPSMSHLLSGGYDSQLFVHSLSSLSPSTGISPSPRYASSSSTAVSMPSTPSPSGPPSPTSAATPTSANSPFGSASTTMTSSSVVTNPIWSLHTDGLVQSVAWLQPNACQGAESGNVFAWGTSGRVLAVGDMRMPGGDHGRPAMEVRCDGMVNSVQSFRQSPNLLVGDSTGSIRHFSLRAKAFMPLGGGGGDSITSAATAAFAAATATHNSATSGTGSGRKTSPPISCLSVNPNWNGREKAGEGRWMASVGFDNFIRIYDRGSDPLKMISSPPKLVHTLKGKNRNWPIKASWFQGRHYADMVPVTKRRGAGAGGTASRTRSRSTSFSSDRHDLSDYSSDEDDDHHHHRHHHHHHHHHRGPRHHLGHHRHRGKAGGGRKDLEADDGDRQKPLSSSLLLAVGSSDPVVLVYDLSGVSDGVGVGVGTGSGGEAGTGNMGGNDSTIGAYSSSNSGESGGNSAAGGGGASTTLNPINSSSSSSAAAASTTATSTSLTSSFPSAINAATAPRLFQRLEGHKDSVYAVDWLQAPGGEEGEEVPGYDYRGPGLLASGGGDWVVRLWKPEFREVE